MNDKQRVADYAAQRIQNGMRVGLGTGSTANCFIDALAARHKHEGLQLQVVASSIISACYAQAAGLTVLGFDGCDGVDIYVDGADEVAPDLTLLKGRGSDLVRENLLATASKAFWVLIDASKRVERIGQHYPIPVEVMPFAWQMVQHRIAAIGGDSVLRKNAAGDNVAITAYGSVVLDCVFAADRDSQQLNQQLNAIPGIVEHGIFAGLTTAVFCSESGQVQSQWAPAP